VSMPSETPAFLDQILGRFHQELEKASEPVAVVRAYSQQYPEYAHEFAAAVAAQGLLADAVAPPHEAHPERLGEFRIVRWITRGGMGDIYEAVQEPLDRRVVVKTIRRGLVSPEVNERFLREQRVLAKLHETHIVPVFAAGEDGRVQYFAMPYIDGASLNHIVRSAIAWESSQASSRTPRLDQFAKMVVDRTTVVGNSPGQATEAKSWNDRRAIASDGRGSESGRESPPGQSGRRLRLSADYFRSVAQVMADAADSVQHAHGHGFLHRDLKPSNIMVDIGGQSWVIDFGLAGYASDLGVVRPSADGPDGAGPMTLTRWGVGTPGYMAPEQECGQKTDVRTDVWGLGVTLYEMLTLDRAFPGYRTAVALDTGQRARPVRPRVVVENVPRDLEAICLKSLHFEPQHRYSTAQEFADDLRRWLRNEPTTARPALAARRTYLWARRNKGWALAIAAASLALISLATGAGILQKYRAIRRMEVRGSLVRDAQFAISSDHRHGWFQKAWNSITDAAEIHADLTIDSQAATALFGLDAVPATRFNEFSAQHLLFDRQGKRLLLGGVATGAKQLLPARVWSCESLSLDALSVAAQGPIGFRADGTPLQLVAESNRLVIVDLAAAKVVTQLGVPADCVVSRDVEPAMTDDGVRVAAEVKTKEDRTRIIVWDGVQAKQLWTFEGEASVLAFSSDSSLLAAGSKDGTIRLWSVKSGKTLCSLRAGNAEVACLAFSRDRGRSAGISAVAEESGWLMAAGDTGGLVTIWGLAARIPLAYCRGSGYQVFSLAFSPDGVTLASSGRADTRLWDVATGRLLLTMPGKDFIVGLAFSPDGRQLAVSPDPRYSRPQVTIWDIDYGRAGRECRGLAGQVEKTTFSPDGKYVAALAHDWQLGVWDATSGFLRHVFIVPPGFTSDNAALAFSPDGKMLAFTTFNDGRLWDTESGRQLKAWKLNPGLADVLAFDAKGRLISCRVETRDGKLGPLSNSLPSEHPRVCRIRNLLAADPMKALAEIDTFNWHVFGTALAPDGSAIAIDGLGGPVARNRLIRVYDSAGKMLLDVPNSVKHGYSVLTVDPSSKLLAVSLDESSRVTLLEIPSGRYRGELPGVPQALSPNAELWLRRGTPNDSELGLWLFRQDDQVARIGLGLNGGLPSATPSFDSYGRRLAWGNTLGGVTICNLKELSRRITQLDPTWSEP